MPAILPAELFRAGREVLSCTFETAITPVAYFRKTDFHEHKTTEQ